MMVRFIDAELELDSCILAAYGERFLFVNPKHKIQINLA